jgi:hypothetical protein
MKRSLIATLALIVPLVLSNPVKAENLNQVKQLLETGECARCDLQGAICQEPI